MYKRNIYLICTDESEVEIIKSMLIEANPFIKDIKDIDSNSFVVSEVFKEYENNFSYEEFRDLLITDLLSNIMIFVAHIHKKAYLEQINFELKMFSFCKGLSYSTYYYKDLIPILFVKSDSFEILNSLKEFLLSVNKEQLETVKLFIENDLNASLTAKKTYIHRNTLNYRLDKFIEQTGIDVRTFKGAAAVYMLLMLNNYN